ncbi:hypothetical protein EC973_008042 [Apophysomyces ossiformis]|uniref:LysM domain-containing protein n=1 Tax=Apophysomyces ossiformis TaxID=679940 RepID=A0A8H7BT41_9FUNG|nr:hypothetical protein EC973_008042 [Apophysomyces ossiformis]
MKAALTFSAIAFLASQVVARPAEGCLQTHIIVEGDSCSSVADQFKLTLDQFYGMNPGLHHAGDHICDNLDNGKPYCVCMKKPCVAEAAAGTSQAASGNSTVATTGAASSATTTTTTTNLTGATSGTSNLGTTTAAASSSSSSAAAAAGSSSSSALSNITPAAASPSSTASGISSGALGSSSTQPSAKPTSAAHQMVGSSSIALAAGLAVLATANLF